MIYENEEYDSGIHEPAIDQDSFWIASSPSKVNADIVLQGLRNFSEIYGDCLPAEKRALLQRLVSEVRVSEDDVTIKILSLPTIPSRVKQVRHIERVG
ncbi:MAG: hypothetical protein JSV31_07820 [Desulfobacterales bacterium]|nr:MAG: hypothetical protein JSV31_07820 [Desulfobacterales bacterium]